MKDIDIIEIKKKYLIFREDAKKILKSIQRKCKKSRAKKISVDFSSVKFMSRSFVDEFINVLESLQARNIKIVFVNLRPHLKKFINNIKERKNQIRKESSVALAK